MIHNLSIAGTGAILESPSPCGGGGGEKNCVTYEFPGGFVVFLFSLVSEERVPKQLEHVSIVGMAPSFVLNREDYRHESSL